MGAGKWRFKEELLSREIGIILLNNNTALGLTLGLHRHSYRACKAKCQADPTPWFYLWFQMNKARYNSSAEHIRDQQSLLHGIAITRYSALPGDIYIASTFHGGDHQTNSHSDSAKGGNEFMGCLASGPQEAPHAAYRATSSYTWESRPCRTWSSPGLVKTHLSGMIIQWATVRTYTRYSGMFSLECSEWQALAGLFRCRD